MNPNRILNLSAVLIRPIGLNACGKLPSMRPAIPSYCSESSPTLRLSRSCSNRRLMDLLFLRVSQINGCSYCVDQHARDLRQAGESNERLDGLAGWRESPYFTEPEKAALEWAEALTRVEVTHAPDGAYEPLTRHYDDKQVANITYAIALMNAWNRVAIGFHRAPQPRSV